MSAELVDPFASPAQPMTQDTYDACRDDIQTGYLAAPERLTEFLAEALACLGVIAQTGIAGDNQSAAACLGRIRLAAVSGIPIYEQPAIDSRRWDDHERPYEQILDSDERRGY